MADAAKRLADEFELTQLRLAHQNLETELEILRLSQRRIKDMLEQMNAQGRRTDAINDNMQSMMSRFEVGGGYPGGADAMMRDFRACFSNS